MYYSTPTTVSQPITGLKALTEYEILLLGSSQQAHAWSLDA